MRISDWSSDVCSSVLLLFSAVIGDRHHRRLVQHDTPTLHVNQGVGRAEIDGHIGRHETHQTREHRVVTSPTGISRRYRLGSGTAQAPAPIFSACFRPVGAFRHSSPPSSEERRVGKECVSTCSSRWSQIHSKKTQQIIHTSRIAMTPNITYSTL